MSSLPQLYSTGSEACDHEKARLLLTKDKQSLAPKLFKFIVRNLPAAWLYASSSTIRDHVKGATDAEAAQKILTDALAKDEIVHKYKWVSKYQNQQEDEFSFQPMEPDLVPAMLREDADAFFTSPQYQELLPAHQTKLRQNMEGCIKAPPLKHDLTAVDKLPSQRLAKGLQTGIQVDEDLWQIIADLCTTQDGIHILPPIVALCIHRPELVISSPACKLTYDNFVKSAANKYKPDIHAWLKSNPLIVDWKEVVQGDELLRGVISTSIKHEVQSWIGAVAVNLMKSEMNLTRHSYESGTPSGTMTHAELITQLKKHHGLRAVLNYHDLCVAEQDDEKEREARKRAAQQTQKEKAEQAAMLKKIKK